MGLNERMLEIQRMGCSPALHSRADVWRAYINVGGLIWAEGPTLQEAFEAVIAEWKHRGYPAKEHPGVPRKTLCETLKK